MRARNVFWLFAVLEIICIIGLFATHASNQLLNGFFMGGVVVSLIITILAAFELVKERNLVEEERRIKVKSRDWHSP